MSSEIGPQIFRVAVRDEQGRPTGEVLEYLACPLTLTDLEKLQPWIDAQFPDPFDVLREAVAKGDYTVMQQQFLMEKAMERATRMYPKVGTPEAGAALSSLEGTRQLLLMSIRKGKPDLTDEEARKIWASMTVAETLGLGLGIPPVVAAAPVASQADSPAPRARRRDAKR